MNRRPVTARDGKPAKVSHIAAARARREHEQRETERIRAEHAAMRQSARLRFGTLPADDEGEGAA